MTQDEAEFYSVQDIQACLQRADLYVSNPNVTAKVNEFQDLANQLLRFVSLIRRPGIVTPSALEAVNADRLYSKIKLEVVYLGKSAQSLLTLIFLYVPLAGMTRRMAKFLAICAIEMKSLRVRIHQHTASLKRNQGKYIGHFTASSKRFKIVPKDGRSNAFCFKSNCNSFKNEKNPSSYALATC